MLSGTSREQHRPLFVLFALSSLVSFSLLWLWLCALLPLAIHAQQPDWNFNQEDVIYFGQSCDLSGPSRFLGQQMELGIRAAFHEINAMGGILGKQLSLITLDDASDAERALDNTRTFLSNPKILSLVGYTYPSINDTVLSEVNGYPFVGPVSGSMYLRQPFQQSIVNVRSSFHDEIVGIAELVILGQLETSIALLFEDNAYGNAGRTTLIEVLQTIPLSLRSQGNFSSGTLDVEQAVIDIAAGNPKVIAMVGSYAPLAKFIQLVKSSTIYKHANNIKFISLSLVDMKKLEDELGSSQSKRNVYVSQVVPPHDNMSLPITKSFVRALKHYSPSTEPSPVIFEGFLTGKLVGRMVQGVVGNLTSSTFINSLYEQSLVTLDGQDIGPYTSCHNDQSLSCLTDNCSNGIRTVWLRPLLGTVESYQRKTCVSSVDPNDVPFIFGQSTYDQEPESEIFSLGINLAFSNYNRKKSSTSKPMRLLKLTHGSAESLSANMEEMVEYANVLGLVGFTGADTFHSTALPLLKNKYRNIPMVGSNVGRAFMITQGRIPNIINIRIALTEEIASLIYHTTNSHTMTRISVMYSSDEAGIEMMQIASTVLEVVNIEPENMIQFEPYSTDEECREILKKIIKDSDPQALIYAGTSTLEVIQLIKVLSYERVALGFRDDLLLGFPSSVDPTTIANGINTFPVGLLNIHASTVNPAPSDYSHPLVNEMREEVSRFRANSTEQRSVNYFSIVEGYLVGQFITNIISGFTNQNQISVSSFIEQIYNSTLIYVKGVPLGNFWRTDSSLCNKGLRTGFVTKYSTSTHIFERVNEKLLGFFTTPVSQCGLESNATIKENVKKPYVLALLQDSDQISGYEMGLSSFFDEYMDTLTTTTTHQGRIKILRVPYNSTTHSVEKLRTLADELVMKNQIFAFVGSKGTVSLDLAEYAREKNIPLIGAMSGSMKLRTPFDKNIINIRASIIDEFVALWRAFKHQNMKRVHIIYQPTTYLSEEIDYIRQFLRLDSREKVKVGYIFPYGDSITLSMISKLKNESVAIFANEPTAANIITEILVSEEDNEYPLLIGLWSAVGFSPSFYTPMKSVFDSIPTMSSRILTTQITPTKGDSSNAIYSSFSATFKAYYPDAIETPEALEGYITASMIQEVFTQIGGAIPEDGLPIADFVSKLYKLSTFDFYGYQLGPFAEECQQQMSDDVCAQMSQAVCGCNQAAREIYVSKIVEITSLTQATVVNIPENKLLIPGCGFVAIQDKDDIPAYAFIILALGIAVIIVVLSSSSVGLFFCCRSKQDKKHAPQKSGIMVCAFTDVQSSTKLWQTDGTAMRKALEIHNRIMRQTLDEYRGYEVKTNGDSFMCMFKRPTDAVDWALGVQKVLLQAKWSPQLLDMYDCRREWDDKTQQVMWNGLRVRIGLHSGYVEYNLDATTKRPDYFGNTINIASKVESMAQGGQVIITDSLFRKTRHLFTEQLLQEDNHLLSIGHEVELNSSMSEISSTVSSSCDDSSLVDSSTGERLTRSERRIKKARLEFYSALDLGEFELKGLEGRVRLYQIKNKEIANRVYQELTPLHKMATVRVSNHEPSLSSHKSTRFRDSVRHMLNPTKSRSSLMETLGEVGIQHQQDQH